MKRTKGKHKANIIAKDIYKIYKKSLETITSLRGNQTKGAYNITKTQHNRILRKLNAEVMELMIKEAYEFKVGFGIGTLSVKKKKIKLLYTRDGVLKRKYLGVNWGETNKLWESDPEAKAKKLRIFYTNEHTDGYKFQFYWDKKPKKIKNKTVYQFIATRYYKRYLNQCLKDPNLNLNFYQIGK